MLIEQLFDTGKPISEDALKEIIFELRENVELDFKTIPPTMDRDAWKEKLLIKPLVSFLNSMSRGGLLILGVVETNHEPTGMPGISKSVIKSTEQLCTIVNTNIECVPQTKGSFRLDCREFNMSNGNSLYFVEVYTELNELFFYSRLSNVAYIREGESSETLSLTDSMSIINKRRCAFLTIDVNEEFTKLNKGFRYGLQVQNGGTKPSENCVTTIEVLRHDNCTLSFTDTKLNLTHLTERPPQFYFKTTEPIYPTLHQHVGYMNVFPSQEKFEIDLKVAIFYETHKVTQVIRLYSGDGILHLKEMEVTKLSYLDRSEV